jgi:hypothetical protein
LVGRRPGEEQIDLGDGGEQATARVVLDDLEEMDLRGEAWRDAPAGRRRRRKHGPRMRRRAAAQGQMADREPAPDALQEMLRRTKQRRLDAAKESAAVAQEMEEQFDVGIRVNAAVAALGKRRRAEPGGGSKGDAAGGAAAEQRPGEAGPSVSSDPGSGRRGDEGGVREGVQTRGEKRARDTGEASEGRSTKRGRG